MTLQALWNESMRYYGEFSSANVAVAVAGTILFALIATAGYRWAIHPLAHIPGPRLARLTGLWRDKQLWNGQWHEEILNIHRKYGRVVRIAPNEVSIVDEFAMKHLYGHGHNAPKTSWYSVWDPPGTAAQLFSELDKKNHAFLRKRLAGAYSMSSVLKYEPYIQACLDLLIEKLEKHADAGNIVDMAKWTNAFAFDVVGELGYGEALGHLRTESDVQNLRKSIFDMFKMLSLMGHFPGQMMLFNNPVTAKLMSITGMAPPMVGFQEWSRKRVQHRMDSPKENAREDLLAHFCRMKNRDGGPAEFGEVLIEVMNLIGAGADTTSIGMRSCLYFIATNPGVYKKLQKEVDDFYETGDQTGPIGYLQTQEMPFLQAVIKEATRMLPSIVFQLLRHAPPAFEVRGFHIPENTPVGISPIAQNRDQDIWGPDADESRPSRWLEDESRTRYHDSSSMTFGGNGPRMCIGRNIALVELHKFLAQFTRAFDYEFTNKDAPWRITTYWFAYQHDFNLRLKRRDVEVKIKS